MICLNDNEKFFQKSILTRAENIARKKLHFELGVCSLLNFFSFKKFAPKLAHTPSTHHIDPIIPTSTFQFIDSESVFCTEPFGSGLLAQIFHNSYTHLCFTSPYTITTLSDCYISISLVYHTSLPALYSPVSPLFSVNSTFN